MRSKASPLVCALVYNGLCTFEFGIAVELFGLPRPEFDNWYRFSTVKAESGPIHAVGGITVNADDDLDALHGASLIVVPGWRGIDAPVPDEICEALRAAHDRGVGIVSICSGVFVLAAAGLLDGRKATTHWRYAEVLAARYPSVHVDPNVLFVEDKGIYTSAGSAAGLDLGLHIIRNDYGAKIAASVARRLVLPAQRDGGQSQFIPRPDPQARVGATLAVLLDNVRAALNEDWPIMRMAHTAGTSSRTLARRFHDEMGITPTAWLTTERVFRAAELLENPDILLVDVWESCGFRSAETFRRTFKHVIGVSPVKYRQRLGGHDI